MSREDECRDHKWARLWLKKDDYEETRYCRICTREKRSFYKHDRGQVQPPLPEELNYKERFQEDFRNNISYNTD